MPGIFDKNNLLFTNSMLSWFCSKRFVWNEGFEFTSNPSTLCKSLSCTLAYMRGGGGGFGPPHEQFAPMDNRQTSLSEVSGTHAHYLWWLAKYYVSCMPTLLSSPTISAALVRPKTSLGSASKMSPIKAAKAVVQPNYCAPFPD